MSPARRLTVTGILAAIAVILMYLEFPIPIIPSFIKFDFSELPALIASFGVGPVEGLAVCLIKNLVKLPSSMTGGVGELANFFIGICFVLPAGLIYRFRKNRGGALIGMVSGTLLMAAASFPINFFIVYPAYSKLMPMEAIIGAYQKILPSVDGLVSCLLIFNLPFTFVKGAVDSLITFLLYKHLSPFLKGKKKGEKESGR
ncbi:MAG: ECF transporter S component [Clostridia bacterium]|nr:ECF transporter S component [Clostridia bacterium]